MSETAVAKMILFTRFKGTLTNKDKMKVQDDTDS